MTTLEHAGISDQGHVRDRNEDCIGCQVPEDPELLRRKGALFVIADGVGGHGAGDIASREAVACFTETYYASRWSPQRALKAAFGRANLHVFDLGIKHNRFQMSTTLSALAIVGGQFHVIHIGDSRIYLDRTGSAIEQLTTDHSEVGDLVRMQILNPDKVRHHPRRNLITRSLGSQTVARPMVRSGFIRLGDRFIMCTDGIWEPVEETVMSKTIASLGPADACQKLVDLGKAGQSTDNLSVQVIHVAAVEAFDQKHASASGIFGKVLRLFGKRDGGHGILEH